MIREFAGRGFRLRAALACFMALAAAAIFGHFQPAAGSTAASGLFSQVEPVHMSMCELFEAAIRLDPYRAEVSERFAAEFAAESGGSAWRHVVGFRASPSMLEAWARAEGPLGVSCRLTYESGGPGLSQNQGMAMWRGVIEAPLSCISRVMQADAVSPEGAVRRAAAIRVAMAEAGAAARAIDMLRKAEISAMQGDAGGAMQAYGELSLLIGLPAHDIRPVVITGDGPARLAELVERALDADPAFLMHEWLTHDPDLIEAECRLAQVGSASSLLDAITVSAGFEWDQSSGGPLWQLGAAVAVGAGMIGECRRPATNEQMALLQQRIDALRAHSTARFAGALGRLRSVWADFSGLRESGDSGPEQIDARRIVEVAGIAFLAGLGVFVWKSQ